MSGGGGIESGDSGSSEIGTNLLLNRRSDARGMPGFVGRGDHREDTGVRGCANSKFSPVYVSTKGGAMEPKLLL